MHEKSTLHYIKLFFIVVIICAVISLVFKCVLLVKNASFKFDSFNILLIDRDAYIVHVEKGDKVEILKLSNAGKILRGKSRLVQSLKLGTFIDASITGGTDSNFSGIENNFISFGNFLKFAGDSNHYKRDNLNNYDLLKIYVDSKLTPKSIKSFKTISKLNKDGYLVNESEFFEFSDPTIFNGKISIQVLNGTDVNGFATKVGGVLRSLGYNLVETGSVDSAKSSVTSSIKSPAVDRLANFFNIPVVITEEPEIADIKLILGEDIVKKNKL